MPSRYCPRALAVNATDIAQGAAASAFAPPILGLA
jgi:hypothetical protein